MSLSNPSQESAVQSFASLLKPIAAREAVEIGGKKLVGRQAVEMEKVKQHAEAAGKAEGQKRGFSAGFEKGRVEGQEQGYADGLKQGYEEALRQKEQEMEKLHGALRQMVKKVNKAMVNWYEQ